MNTSTYTVSDSFKTICYLAAIVAVAATLFLAMMAGDAVASTVEPLTTSDWQAAFGTGNEPIFEETNN